MSRLQPHPERYSEDSEEPTNKLVRRDVLKGSVGVAVLLASPDMFSTKHKASVRSRRASAGARNAAVATVADATLPYFFIYGIPGPGPTPGPSLGVGRSSASASAKAAAISLAPVATQLAAVPVESPDGSSLALLTVDGSAGMATVSIYIVDRLSTAITSSGKLALPGVKDGTSLLVTPTFSADSRTVALALSVTVPTHLRQVTKGPSLGQASQLIHTATWTCHHELAYFKTDTASFTGPFHISDAPSLPRVNVGADSEAFYLWTVEEITHGTKRHPQPAPVPRLTSFTLGSGATRFSVPAPGPWPVNREPVVTLPTGDIARLVNGRTVQVLAPRSGAIRNFDIAPLQLSSAKPGPATMQLRSDGLIFLARAAIGRAVLVDPARSFRVLSAVSYPVPFHASGPPVSKAVLSADGTRLYTLGGVHGGGLSAYDVANGSLVASYSRGVDYSGLYQLASGTLLAIGTNSPRLGFFTPSLSPAGTGDTDLNVTAVF